MEWTYDTAGHRLSESVTLDSGEVVTRSWTYDHDWIASEQVVSSAAPAKIFRSEYTFNYGPDGRPVSVQSQKRRKHDGSFQVTSYAYDARNRLVATTLPDGVNIVNEYTGDFVTHRYFEVAGSAIPQKEERFEYDTEGRLIKQWDARNNLTQFANAWNAVRDALVSAMDAYFTQAGPAFHRKAGRCFTDGGPLRV